MSTEEMIARLNEAISGEHDAVNRRVDAMRRDLETEITRVKTKLANLGEAVGVLTAEASRAPRGSKLSPEACKRITELLNT